MLKKLLSVLLLVGLGAVAQAADGAQAEVPAAVWWQLINFIAFLIILFFALRKRIPVFFASKREAFLAHEKKAQEEKEQALRAKKSIQDDLEKLLSGKDEGLERARQEAQLFADRMNQEAKDLVQRLQEELERTEKIEMEKVLHSVRSQLIERSVGRARDTIKKDLVEADDKRLQSEFVDKIQVVS